MPTALAFHLVLPGFLKKYKNTKESVTIFNEAASVNRRITYGSDAAVCGGVARQRFVSAVLVTLSNIQGDNNDDDDD